MQPGLVSLYSGGTAPEFHPTSERPSVCERCTMVSRLAAGAQAGRQATNVWTAPASFGELVQGFHRRRWLQIAAPVDLYRFARAEAAPAPPPTTCRRYAKVQRGLRILLRGQPHLGVRVLLGGDAVPRGVGFGSSSADLGAALRAAAHALELARPSEAVVEAALEVEPTGGALLPGLTLFDHQRGTIRESLGPPPPLTLLGIRLPGSVDTVDFNRRLPERLPEEALRGWERAFRLCAEGIERGDAEQIGAASSESAELSHHLGCLPPPPGLARCARETAAAGIVRAHSGTLWGLLYAEGEAPEVGEVAQVLSDMKVGSVAVLPASSPALVTSLSLGSGGMRRASPGLPFERGVSIVARQSEGATGSSV